MNHIETIQKRRSVRTYTGEPLREEHSAQIRQYIDQLQAPFGVKARIELIHTKSDEEPIKLGTYGWVKGACDYLVLIYEDAPLAETAAAYMFEEAVLFCTHLGLGTCWLGGSFSRGDFKKQVSLGTNEKLRIVSPVGYPGGGQRFLEKYIVQADKKHSSRKPFGELFFEKDFTHPLTEDSAGKYSQPLEMVRLAPSANNKQEWRVLYEEKVLHFYKKPYLSFDSIDIGIALCHFELSCRELGIAGRYEVVKDFPEKENLDYVISWIQEE
ncbi:nitroreductase Nfs [Parabacteroides sp. 52]|uniref:nitroreductase family protein n=1 Tax=unclassified Parabacteroides TaxID=2649774 RepID=UPI0013D39C85|nr:MULTISPECIES: nitroreductase family protein [unclassified Parabacteroides]MDH6534303.1 nitroreductase [Parabacteroides sp. PM5-20]NDV54802.1 nitroreductase Nfs [Parabacteroides sp. 52]